MNRRTFIKSGALFVPMIFVPKLIRAQSLDDAVQAALIMRKRKRAGGGGGGTITLIGSGVSAGSSDELTVTTPSYNTTGATLIVIVQSSAGGANTPSDSKGNTWTQVINEPTFGNNHSSIYYCASPTTDSAQTFTATYGGTGEPTLIVYAFSGATGVLDKNSGGFNNGSTTTCQPGSVTPTTSGQLVISGFSYQASVTASVDSGLSNQIDVGFSLFHHQGNSAAFKIQSVAAAINPQWTASGTGNFAATLATFK
jgi:hypothetical protein